MEHLHCCDVHKSCPLNGRIGGGGRAQQSCHSERSGGGGWRQFRQSRRVLRHCGEWSDNLVGEGGKRSGQTKTCGVRDGRWHHAIGFHQRHERNDGGENDRKAWARWSRGEGAARMGAGAR
jgi:hypothetical protein